MDEQNTAELKKFAALTKKKNVNEAYITRVVLAETKADAEKWFGENNFHIHGEVYRSGK